MQSSLCDAGSRSHIPGAVESSELLVLRGLRNLTAIVRQNDLSSVQTFSHTDICGSVLLILQLPIIHSFLHNSSAPIKFPVKFYKF